MNKKFNLNKLSPNDNDWIDEVNENFEEYITDWISDYKKGILLKEDVIRVAEKVAELRNDKDLVAMIMQRL